MDGEFKCILSPADRPKRVVSVTFIPSWEEANAFEELENEVRAPVILLDECIHLPKGESFFQSMSPIIWYASS